MIKDFYLNDRSAAAYFEKDWFDHVVAARAPFKFGFAPFDPHYIYSDYHQKLVGLLHKQAQKNKAQPKSLLEIGSSLGRTFYEVCGSLKSLKKATLIEPSQNLFGIFQKIFNGSNIESFPVLTGNKIISEVTLNTSQIKSACSAVDFSCLNTTFQEFRGSSEKADLVICSNVIDQCHEHMELAEFLKDTTAPGGLLVLSCTYQWQNKYIGNAGHQIRNINEFFGPGWKLLGEDNFPFQLRVYERHWMTFLSHAVVYLKV